MTNSDNTEAEYEIYEDKSKMSNPYGEHNYPPRVFPQQSPNGGYESRERNAADKASEGASQYGDFLSNKHDEATKVGASTLGTVGAGVGLYSVATAAVISPWAVAGAGAALVAQGVNAGVNSKQAFDKYQREPKKDKKKA